VNAADELVVCLGRHASSLLDLERMPGRQSLCRATIHGREKRVGVPLDAHERGRRPVLYVSDTAIQRRLGMKRARSTGLLAIDENRPMLLRSTARLERALCAARRSLGRIRPSTALGTVRPWSYRPLDPLSEN
jgi:hypothetical protein